MLPIRAASAAAAGRMAGTPVESHIREWREPTARGRTKRMDIGAGGTRSNADRALPQASPGSSRGRLLGLPSPLPQFFATASVPCPYIPGRAERKLIVELGGGGAPGFYDALSRLGFRRSHRFAYRPACRACAACVPVRIAVARFTPTRSIRRVRNVHAGIEAAALAPRATIEQFRLFIAYQRSRHQDSEMAAMNYGDYRGMIETPRCAARSSNSAIPTALSSRSR